MFSLSKVESLNPDFIVGALEGQHFRKTGKLVSLSEQNLVDCTSASHGCEGGSVYAAFMQVKKEGGIDTEDSYPYHAEQGVCHFDRSHIGATDVGYTKIKACDENALKIAVATVGPISVAIDASHSSFQFPKKGVYYEPNCKSGKYDLDHAVLVVGYGSEDRQDYWLVKNSWGSGWGDNGYIKMARNRDNHCGIATEAVYPLV